MSPRIASLAGALLLGVTILMAPQPAAAGRAGTDACNGPIVGRVQGIFATCGECVSAGNEGVDIGLYLSFGCVTGPGRYLLYAA